jgi:shikimate kinase
VAKKIVLIGYMGVGKTFLGEKLSKVIEMPYYDLDDLIEKEVGMSVQEIFKIKGEIFFRRIERKVLEEKLSSKDSFVLSTGGGTPCYYDNYRLLKQNKVSSVYLKASISTLAERLKNEKETRPLLKQLSDSELTEFIGKHLFERSYYYGKANFTVEVDEKPAAEIIQEIIDKVCV